MEALIISIFILAGIAGLTSIITSFQDRPPFIPCLAIGISLAAAVAGASLTLHYLAPEPPTAPATTLMEA